MKIIYSVALTALAMLAGRQTTFAIADPAVLGAVISPAPAVYPNGPLESFQFQINNNGSSTSSALVKVTISFTKLDFNDGTFDPLVDIEQTAGSTPFIWTWDSSIKTMTGTLNGTFGNFAFNTFIIKNLAVLAASDIGTPNIGGNVNIVAPAPVNSSTTNDNTFAATYSTVPLPIHINSFSAIAKGNCMAELKWAVTNAEAFSHFVLEHSTTGVDFTALKSVAYDGSQSDYSYTYDAGAGKHYYRLKLVDADGRYLYSKIMQTQMICGETAGSLLAYPSPVPAGSRYKVKYEGSVSGTATLKVIDMAGRVVDQRSVELTGGTDIFDMKTLSAGSYTIELNNGKGLRIWSSCAAL